MASNYWKNFGTKLTKTLKSTVKKANRTIVNKVQSAQKPKSTPSTSSTNKGRNLSKLGNGKKLTTAEARKIEANARKGLAAQNTTGGNKQTNTGRDLSKLGNGKKLTTAEARKIEANARKGLAAQNTTVNLQQQVYNKKNEKLGIAVKEALKKFGSTYSTQGGFELNYGRDDIKNEMEDFDTNEKYIFIENGGTIWSNENARSTGIKVGVWYAFPNEKDMTEEQKKIFKELKEMEKDRDASYPNYKRTVDKIVDNTEKEKKMKKEKNMKIP